ncbi:MAG: hypothetical protein J07HQX50_01401 [Haloquadratum sp. J07HQX50]|nr:MAG: hypothetical protein J07HQX50_01401 [Haloquadratum sp. J07HQX50]
MRFVSVPACHLAIIEATVLQSRQRGAGCANGDIDFRDLRSSNIDSRWQPEMILVDERRNDESLPSCMFNSTSADRCGQLKIQSLSLRS